MNIPKTCLMQLHAEMGRLMFVFLNLFRCLLLLLGLLLNQSDTKRSITIHVYFHITAVPSHTNDIDTDYVVDLLI